MNDDFKFAVERILHGLIIVALGILGIAVITIIVGQLVKLWEKL